MPSLAVRKMTEAAVDIAEAVTPGAKVVAELRRTHPAIERPARAELLGLYNELADDVERAALSFGGILIEANRNETNRIMAILQASNVAAWSKDKITPVIEKAWREVIKRTLVTLNKNEIKLTLRDKLEKELLLQGAQRETLLDIKGETKEALFRVLEKGRQDGLNPRDTARLIRDEIPKGRFVDAGSKYRAELIARTEVLEAQRHSSIKMYETSDVIKGVVAFDGDSDALCMARNGEEFTFAQALAQAEGTHPNCVLAFGPVT